MQTSHSEPGVYSKQRIKAVRNLCQELPLSEFFGSEEAAAAMSPRQANLVTAATLVAPRRATRLLEDALNLLPSTPECLAIKSALGAGTGAPPTLAERRAAFMRDHDISLRTLIRREESGAVLLLQVFDQLKVNENKSWMAQSAAKRLEATDAVTDDLFAALKAIVEELGTDALKEHPAIRRLYDGESGE